MKKMMFLFAFTLLFGANFLNAQTALKVANVSTEKMETSTTDVALTWDKKTFEFGKIPQGIPAKATFELTNTSNEPLIITKVKGSCGCTATAHEEAPILPGETTTITATYNAMKTGAFNKSVRVSTSLSEEPMVLMIKGNVMEKK